PILVDEALMPTPETLPDGLRDLHYRNAAPIRNDPDFNRDITRLISTIQEHFPSSVAPAANPAPTASPATPVPQAAFSPAPNTHYHPPWAGSFGGVLLVIAVLATMRVVSKIADNIGDQPAPAVAKTATAQLTTTPATSTPDLLITAEHIVLLTEQARITP